jgi:hypothetical protein
MPKFRKKPIVIEAVQFIGDNWDEILEFLGYSDPSDAADQVAYRDGVLFISTLEGTMKALSNDWIIRGVAFELYPCKPDIFTATYERVED